MQLVYDLANPLMEDALYEVESMHRFAHLHPDRIPDAGLIAAPPSAKNAQGERDPDMHSVMKGNEWYFGIKIYIGVDDALGLTHRVETTSAEVHDLNVADKLLHGDEKIVWGDTGYMGIEKR